jgi:nitrite reductase (NADH) small subunit
VSASELADRASASEPGGDGARGRSPRARPARLVGPALVAVCRVEDLEPERGAAVLVDGVQVALFRVIDAGGEHVHAVDNLDPACGAPVIARGIVGTAEDRWFVASPMYKHRYDLRTGSCLTDPTLTLRTHAVEVRHGTVHVRVER